MARQRTIIGIGEALLAEYPGAAAGVPAGLALDVAIAAVKLGHRGLPISRLGQDLFANELLTQLAAIDNLSTTLLQSDPDLPTGRLIVRSIAGVRKETLDHRAAFDNLQWDFDLVDVAKEADAVIFGMLAQRGGQSSSIITRFLAEATGAILCCDLTNRADETFDRPLAFKSLEIAHVAVIDTTALSILRLGRPDAPHEETARTLLREFDLAAAVRLDPNQPMEAFAQDGSAATQGPVERAQHTLAVVALLHAMLRGDETAKAVETAERIMTQAREKPDEPLTLE